MNFNYKNINKYIKLPTHEPERISQIYSSSSNSIQEEKIISKIKRDLIIYNIIISLIITLIVVTVSIKLTDKKWRKNSKLKSVMYEHFQIKKIHQKYIESCINGELLQNINIKNFLNPIISIIIPVYNKEKYILRILRSIQNQNFDNI